MIGRQKKTSDIVAPQWCATDQSRIHSPSGSPSRRQWFQFSHQERELHLSLVGATAHLEKTCGNCRQRYALRGTLPRRRVCTREGVLKCSLRVIHSCALRAGAQAIGDCFARHACELDLLHNVDVAGRLGCQRYALLVARLPDFDVQEPIFVVG